MKRKDWLDVEILFDCLVEELRDEGRSLDWIEENLLNEVDRAIEERRDVEEKVK